MKAVVCEKFGGPDELKFKKIPCPVIPPNDNEVVITVYAAGVAFTDTLMIENKVFHHTLQFLI